MNLLALNSLLLAVALCASGTAVAAQTEPEKTDTSAAATVFTSTQLLDDLSKQLTERLQLKGELQLDFNRPWATPAATGPVECVLLGCPSRLTSSLLLQVRLQSGDRVLGVYSLSLKAQLFREVWVARAPLERGTNFDPNQLEARRVDLLQEREAVPTEGTDGEYSFATTVPAGRQLAWRDLARRTLIRKGQIIDVSAVDGLLSITTKALAMENGAAGDTVKLRNLESKKDFSALVVAEARAQVRF